MSLILIQSENTFYPKNQNKLVLSDNFFKHRSISLIPKKQKETLITYEKKSNSNHTINHNNSLIQEVNRFKINNNLYTHKTKKSSNIDERILPIVSIDLNESSTLKKEEISNFNSKLIDLSIERIKLLKLNYIKELANLRDCIDKTLEKINKIN